MQIKITWFGTANYLLTLNDTNLLFDPFFYRNPQSFPQLITKKEDIKNINAIFISHGHFDHLTEAGWFVEQLDVPVYCSEVAKGNIIQWAAGEILEDNQHELSKRAIEKIKVCEFFETIKITETVNVELIKSEHVKFDLYTILSRLFSWKFLKQAKSMAYLGRAFPMGKVFGFCTTYSGKKIISFGSLWHEYEEELKKYENCDVFIVPMAGNSKRNMVKKAGKMVDILKPKYVIPIHWDNFYPPISRLENINPFFKFLKNKYPEVQIVMPIMDDEIVIEL
jgi:L-ascorbate metabolism protein UlaG (beta-lactamase superfamily)